MASSSTTSGPSEPVSEGETRETRDQIPTDLQGETVGADQASDLIPTPVSRVSPRHSNPAALHERMAALAGLGMHLVAMGQSRVPAFEPGYTERPVEQITAESLAAMVGSVTGTNRRPILGAHMVLGSRSAKADGPGSLLTLALELEGRAVRDDRFLVEWSESLEQLVPGDLADVVGLCEGERGWVELTPSGGLRVFFRVHVPAKGEAIADAWVATRRELASRKVERGGKLYAEILDLQAIVAPSEEVQTDGACIWHTIRGGPAAMPVISIHDLHIVASLLDSLTDASSTASTQPRCEDLPARAAAVRRIYNNRATTEQTVELLRAAGWRIQRADKETGEVGLIKPGSSSTKAHAHVGGRYRAAGGVMVWTTEGPLGDGYWHAFDLLAEQAHGGSAIACAEALLASGAVRLRTQVLAARTRPEVRPSETPTPVLVARIVHSVAEAQHPTLSDVPLVVMHTATDATGADRPIGPVSLATDGTVHRWSDPAQLILAAVQPVEVSAHSRKCKHSIDAAVRDAFDSTLRKDQALRSARYLADRPVITNAGTVVAEPGWHPEHQALVVIPHRDRERWTKGYSVPSAPTIGDAQTAVDYLITEVLGDFPFDGPADQARALVCMVSHVARDLTATQPAFLLDAADRGSGKSLLAEVCRLLAYGSTRALSVGYRRADDEETIKQVVGGALSGLSALHVDELPRGERITSTFLSELVTAAGGVEKRVLGANRLITLPPATLTIAGNNAEVGADWTRRIVPIRLVHRGDGLAHSRGGFRHPDLLGWVAEHRPALLSATHTIIVRSIQQHHKPVPGFGSFEAWSALVLGGLSEVTIDDIAVSELVVEDRSGWTSAHDELADEWGELFRWWAASFADTWVTAAEAHKKATGSRPSPALPDVLGAFAFETGSGAARRWGRALQAIAETSILHGGEIYRLAKQNRGSRGNAYAIKVLPAQGAPPPVAEERYLSGLDGDDTEAGEGSDPRRVIAAPHALNSCRR